MKFITALFVLFSFSAFADLQEGMSPGLKYNDVQIYEVKAVLLQTRKVASTLPKGVRFVGTLSMKVMVEGNICDDTPSTLGVEYSSVERGTLMSLKTAGMKRDKPVVCAAISKPTMINMVEYID